MFVDMDGVVCWFRKAASSRIGMDVNSKEFDDLGQAKRNKLFSEACDTVDFWVSLEPMPDYNELWGYVKYWSPSILTAYPVWSKQAKDVAIKGKALWNKSHMMVPEQRFHCVERKDKQKFALNSERRSNILIDDKPKNIEEWIAAGGIGILHINAAQTILQLRNLGFIK